MLAWFIVIFTCRFNRDRPSIGLRKATILQTSAAHEQLYTFVEEKRSHERDWDSKQSNLRVPGYQLSRITLFGVYPRFCYSRRRRRKCIFPTRLGFMLSCLSGTYRNGAHSGSMRTFVVTFLRIWERKRDSRWILRMRNLRRPAATSRSLGHRREESSLHAG